MTYADVKRNRSEIRRQKREERIAKENIRKRKVMGISMITISIMSIILSNGDVTFAVTMGIPMSIYMCIAREV